MLLRGAVGEVVTLDPYVALTVPNRSAQVPASKDVDDGNPACSKVNRQHLYLVATPK